MIKTIAIILLMLIVNLLMFFSIRRAAVRVDYTMRKLFLQKMSSGDGEITSGAENETSEKTQTPEGAAEKEVVTKTIVYAPPVEIREAAYKNKNIREEYRTIKGISRFTPEYALRAAKKRVAKEEPDAKNTERDYESFLSMLSFDLVYALTSLEPPVQEQLLRENTDPEYHGIIDSFKAEHEGRFDAAEFYAYLRQMADMYNSGFVIRSGNREEDGKVLSDGSRVEYDEGICEGAKVIYKNRMYDYSL